MVALFATGLKLERELTFRGWRNVARLLLVAMPLTIGAIALFGSLVMGLSLGAAIALGACLAPTDPVLAGRHRRRAAGRRGRARAELLDHRRGGPTTGSPSRSCCWASRSPRATISSSGRWPTSRLRDRHRGIAIGARLGYGSLPSPSACVTASCSHRELDGWVAIGAVAVIYGATEIVGAYGFLAAFAGGIGFRRYEHTHERNRGVHDGAEIVEDVAELALILLLGSCVTLTGLGEPGVSGWMLVPVLLLVIRPAAVLLSSPAHAGDAARAGVRRVVRRAGDRLAVLRVGGHRGRRVQRAGHAGHLLDRRRGGPRLIAVHGISATPLARRWIRTRADGRRPHVERPGPGPQHRRAGDRARGAPVRRRRAAGGACQRARRGGRRRSSTSATRTSRAQGGATSPAVASISTSISGSARRVTPRRVAAGW